MLPPHMPTPNEIREKVRGFILESYMAGLDPAQLKDDVSLERAHIVDSARVLELILFLEETFGFEVTNDVGTHMFPGYTGKWIQDSPSQRKMVMDRLRTWNAFSASNPSQGIVSAIRTYWAEDKKISLYVFGDEFTGPSIDSVVKAVDFVNRTDKSGERRVRIHAVGFPVTPQAPQYTSIRFAALMRIICQKNGGTFVGMHEAENHSPHFS